MVPLETPQGQQFVANIADAALPRVCTAAEVFEAQLEPTWCGLASIATALRLLSSLEPSCLSRAITSSANQESLFLQESTIRGGTHRSSRQLAAGLSLAEGERLLSVVLRNEVSVSVRRQSASDVDIFGLTLADDLERMASSASNEVLLVNVLRLVKGSWTGHWMVIAASVKVPGGDGLWALALDPAAHKLGPHWLPIDLLAATMCTRNYRDEPRGYLCVTASPPPIVGEEIMTMV